MASMETGIETATIPSTFPIRYSTVAISSFAISEWVRMTAPMDAGVTSSANDLLSTVQRLKKKLAAS
jgi:hypothetical protein